MGSEPVTAGRSARVRARAKHNRSALSGARAKKSARFLRVNKLQGSNLMATHRVSFPHLTRTPDQLGRGQSSVARPLEHAEPNFGLFMLAPVIIAMTLLATAWISRVSFGG